MITLFSVHMLLLLLTTALIFLELMAGRFCRGEVWQLPSFLSSRATIPVATFMSSTNGNWWNPSGQTFYDSWLFSNSNKALIFRHCFIYLHNQACREPTSKDPPLSPELMLAWHLIFGATCFWNTFYLMPHQVFSVLSHLG